MGGRKEIPTQKGIEILNQNNRMSVATREKKRGISVCIHVRVDFIKPDEEKKNNPIPEKNDISFLEKPVAD